MAIIEDYNTVVMATKSEFPGFKLIPKNKSILMKLVNAVLQVVTFGQMKSFMKSYTTTIGQKVYTPEDWESYNYVEKLSIVRHERVHMRQAKRHGRILFSLMYLLLPFPVGVAYFRKKFEQEAYEQNLRTIYQYMGRGALDDRKKEFILSQFTSSSYLWMWPFKKDLEKWYDSVVDNIKSGR